MRARVCGTSTSSRSNGNYSFAGMKLPLYLHTEIARKHLCDQ